MTMKCSVKRHAKIPQTLALVLMHQVIAIGGTVVFFFDRAPPSVPSVQYWRDVVHVDDLSQSNDPAGGELFSKTKRFWEMSKFALVP